MRTLFCTVMLSLLPDDDDVSRYSHAISSAFGFCLFCPFKDNCPVLFCPFKLVSAIIYHIHIICIHTNMYIYIYVYMCVYITRYTDWCHVETYILQKQRC